MRRLCEFKCIPTKRLFISSSLPICHVKRIVGGNSAVLFLFAGLAYLHKISLNFSELCFNLIS